MADRCVVGAWYDALDTDDTIEFDQATEERSRIDVYKLVCEAAELDGKPKPYGLTSLKMHVIGKCGCN